MHIWASPTGTQLSNGTLIYQSANIPWWAVLLPISFSFLPARNYTALDPLSDTIVAILLVVFGYFPSLNEALQRHCLFFAHFTEKDFLATFLVARFPFQLEFWTSVCMVKARKHTLSQVALSTQNLGCLLAKIKIP